MIAPQWLKQACGTEPDTSGVLRHDNLVFTTDRKRLHATLGAPPGVGAQASPRVVAALQLFCDDAKYEDVEADVWEITDDLLYVGHLFEGTILDHNFFNEALAGLGTGFSCAMWKDSHLYGPVRFRSADGKRTAYVMPFNMPEKD